MRSWREKCGCVVTDSEFKSMCDEHAAEFKATHDRWQAEHVERQQQREVECSGSI